VDAGQQFAELGDGADRPVARVEQGPQRDAGELVLDADRYRGPRRPDVINLVDQEHTWSGDAERPGRVQRPSLAGEAGIRAVRDAHDDPVPIGGDHIMDLVVLTHDDADGGVDGAHGRHLDATVDQRLWRGHAVVPTAQPLVHVPTVARPTGDTTSPDRARYLPWNAGSLTALSKEGQ
jgi:hypothetical protein